jgi:alkylhydroperoxidase family enzyme
MARLSQIDVEKLPGKLGHHYQYLKQALGRINTYTRVSANLPHVTKFAMLMPMVLQREGAGGVLSARIKEMVILKTSFINNSEHCIAHNVAMGEATGITSEQMDVIRGDNYMESDLLTPRQKAAVLWAEHVTRNTARDRDDVFQHMRSLFSEPEILELTLVSAHWNMSNRTMNALHMDITHPDVEKIRGSFRANPDNVKKYLEAILENWPDEFPVPSKD